MRRRCRPTHTQALQQRLVAEASLEAASCVLNQAVEDDEGAYLAVDVSVLELFADGTRSLARARGLDRDDLDKLGDAAEVLLLVGLGGEVLDGDGHGGEWFLAEANELAGGGRRCSAHGGGQADIPAWLLIARPAGLSRRVLVVCGQSVLDARSERSRLIRGEAKARAHRAGSAR